MIDEKELMVGNYVCYNNANGYITKVEDIRRYGDDTIGYEYGITCTRDERDPLHEKSPKEVFNVRTLHPIQLTCEILDNNGFKCGGFGKCAYAQHCGKIIGIFIEGVQGELHFEYVHELQNAFRLFKINNKAWHNRLHI